MDTASQSPADWLLNIQRKLYQWSQQHRDEAFGDLWNWITDGRNLEVAWGRVRTNQGRNTPGIDGVTVKKIEERLGVQVYLAELRRKLRDGSFQPSPVRQKLIPKAGQPTRTRALGIPTIADRVVQKAILQIIEPLCEARFYHVSMGFRPGRSVRDAIELVRRTTRCLKKDEAGRRIDPPYEWIIEGDIKACFDNINHHALMNRVRKVIADKKVTRIITAFLKAGIMKGDEYQHSQTGTPQGGILSPLLANIALSAIEERYLRWVYAETDPKGRPYKRPLSQASNHRREDRRRGKPVFYPVRYADDFVLICSGTEEEILAEKSSLAKYLREELGLELSEEKTQVTTLKHGFDFLGHHVRLYNHKQWGLVFQALVPLDRQERMRRKIKMSVRQTPTQQSLAHLLARLNPLIRGWGNFYRHANGAYLAFKKMDYYIFIRVFHWLRKKFKTTKWNKLYRTFRKAAKHGGMKRWQQNGVESAQLLDLERKRWDLRFTGKPDYAKVVGEPGA